ncbi:MAG: hypothetical protein ACTSQI_12035 [Candidatus Helarchaeota archaeon]
MILGVYIFIKRGRKLSFRRELKPFDAPTREKIDMTLIKIVNKFESYEEGFYRVRLEDSRKILFAVYGEVLSIVLIEIEPISAEKPLTPDLLEANDALFASIVFNQPLLTELIQEEAGEESFSFYTEQLPAEKAKTLQKPAEPVISGLGEETRDYIRDLDKIIGGVSNNLRKALRESEFVPEKKRATIELVFANFMELTFRYVRMYLMESLIRDLIEDHAGRPITEIRMGVNDLLFYVRKAIHVLRDRPEIKYFLKIMDGHNIGIKIKNRTEFTVQFLGDQIKISDGISAENPLVYFETVDLVINLILGRFDVMKVALSKTVRATQLHKLVRFAAPFTAVLIRIYENRFEDKHYSIKQLSLEGMAHLVETLFSANLKINPQKRDWIQGIHKRILLHIVDMGILTLIVKGPNVEVKIGKTQQEPDVIIQGYLKDICLYTNNEVSFVHALRKIKLLKGISMHPIDILKGKTFSQLSELFTLWRISRI